MKTKIITLAFMAILSVLIYFSLFTVEENEVVIITRFGKPVRTIQESGLQIKLPGMLEIVNHFSKSSNLFETQPTQLLLGDKKPIIISCYVLWKICDPLLYFQSMGHSKNAIQNVGDIVNSQLSIVLSEYNIENIINTESDKVLISEIENKVTDISSIHSVHKYGIEIQRTGVQRLAYPSVVIDSVHERMRTERIKEAEKIKAEGNEAAQIIRAEAKRQANEIIAEAEKQALIIKGEGDFESMNIYTAAYKEGGEFFDFIQSMEAYESILDKDTTLILSTESELFKYLHLNQ